MDVLVELAALTDAEAAQCLNRILSGAKARDANTITSPQEVGSILGAVAAQAGQPFTAKIDADLPEHAKAVRIVLLEFRDPQLRGLLEGALASQREMLFEPITTALAMAGIVLILKTRVGISFKRDKSGKWEVEGNIESKAASEVLIKKFLGVFDFSRST